LKARLILCYRRFLFGFRLITSGVFPFEALGEVDPPTTSSGRVSHRITKKHTITARIQIDTAAAVSEHHRQAEVKLAFAQCSVCDREAFAVGES